MRCIQASGSFYKVGKQVGERCKDDIADVYKRTVSYLLKYTKIGSVARMHEVAAYYMLEAKRLWAPSFEFLSGMAKGAGVTMNKIALTAFSEEVSSEKCSTLVSRLLNGNHLIIHNEDFPPEFGSLIMLDVTFDGYPRFVCLTYIGQLPSLAGSLNVCGVATTNNGLWPDAQPGWSKQVLHFRASLARSLDEAEERLMRRPTSLTTHYVVAYGPTHQVDSLAVSNFQTSHREVTLLPIKGASFCHTNHVLPGYLGLKMSDPAVENSPNSFSRYDKLNNLTLEELPRTPQEAFKLFANQDDDNVLFRKPKKEGESGTKATVVICAETLEFWVRDANTLAMPRDQYICLRV